MRGRNKKKGDGLKLLTLPYPTPHLWNDYCLTQPCFNVLVIEGGRQMGDF